MTNRVGIGTTTPATSNMGAISVDKLNVYSTTVAAAATSGDMVEFVNATNSPGTGSVSLLAENSSSNNDHNAFEGITQGTYAGVFGLHIAGSGVGYGVYGVSNSGSGWAGYFNGRVYAISYSGSDRRFKKEIKDLPDGTLNKILQLKPSEYYYNTEEYPVFKAFDGKRFGLIAQDLEKVFPEVVDNKTPIPNPKKIITSASQAADNVSGYYSVDYVSLIPILIKGMQEQQKMIEDQKKQLEDQNQRIKILEGKH
jgi:hypothetical protein